MLVGGAEKLSAEHLARLACPYVRQSTAAQVRNNTESRELQYELKERAIGLGWPEERVSADFRVRVEQRSGARGADRRALESSC